VKTIYLVAAIIAFSFGSPRVNGQGIELTTANDNRDVLYVDGEHLKPLEGQKVYIRTKASLSMYILGMGTVRISYVVPGIQSPTRIQTGEKLKFIVKTLPSADPCQPVSIFKLTPECDNLYRSVETRKFSTFSGNTDAMMETVPYKVKKCGNGSYWIELQSQLTRGEYAITMKGDKKIFNLFGID
jgi:hypothetical protein